MSGSTAKGEESLNLWRAPSFSKAGLDEYISSGSEFYGAFWSAFEPRVEDIPLSAAKAEIQRYALNHATLIAELRKAGFITQG